MMSDTKNLQIGKKFIWHTVLICLLLLAGGSCKEAMYAPVEEDTIHLSANPISIKPGQTSEITVTGVKANGRPMPDNTVVILTADNGTFQDQEEKKNVALLLVGGKGTIIYKADDPFTGEAITITANAGAAAIKPEQLVISIEKDIQKENLPPVAAFTFSPKNPRAGETVWFNAEASTDPDGDGINYNWDFGDGKQNEQTPKKEKIVNWAYKNVTEEKIFIVTLIVTDSKKAESVATAEITVRPSPVARLSFTPDEPVVNELVTFYASESEGDIKTYEWYFGDRTYKSTGAPVVMHEYTEAREYRVVLKVTDINKRISTIVIKLKVQK